MKMKKLTALLLSTIMAMSSAGVTAVAEDAPLAAAGGEGADASAVSEQGTADTTYDENDADVDLTPTGGVIQPQAIEIEGEPKGVKEYTLADYAASVAEDGIALFSADSSSGGHYDSEYGFDSLGEFDSPSSARDLYRMYDIVASEFETSDKNMVPSNDAALAYIGKVDYGIFGLTKDEALAVYALWQADNPQYFWLWNGVYTSESYSQVYMTIPEQYFSAESRHEGQELIAKKAQEFKAAADQYSTNYEKAMIVHDIMTSENIYDYGTDNKPATAATDHNVIGALDDDLDGVCESFAKAYSLAMNYIGVDCVYAVSNDHAWNYVKMDDGNYYGVDVTWDVNWNNTGDYNDFYKWFAKGSDYFTQNNEHIPRSTTGTGLFYFYDVPEIPKNDYIQPEGATITNNGFTYQKVGHSLILIDARSASGDVTLPAQIGDDYLRVIAGNAFAGSTITSITIPETVAKIDNGKYYSNGAFANCKKLTKVDLPSGLRYIGAYAFYDCDALSELYVPYKTSSNKSSNLVISDFAIGHKLITDSSSTDRTDITIKGKLNSHAMKYANEHKITFIPDNESIENCDIKVYSESMAYDNHELKPYVTVRENGKYLIKDVDYTIEYQNNVYEGMAAIVIKGIEPYAGEVVKPFHITSCEHQNAYIYTTRDSSCLTAGYNTYHCPVCGKSWNVALPLADHNYVNGQCKVCKAYENGVGKILEIGASLGDCLNIRFKFDANDDIRESIANGKAKFAYTIGDTTYYATEYEYKGGYYYFVCPINSKQMNETITANLVVGSKKSNVVTTSFKKYSDTIGSLAESGSAEAQNSLDLVNATYAYGCYAQRYFDHNSASEIDDDTKTAIDAVDLSSLENMNVYKNADKSITGLKFHGDSLLLESKTAQRFYFDLSEGYSIDDYTFTCGGKTLVPGTKNGRYYVDVEGIAPNQLAVKNILTVTRGSEALTVENSPMSYVYLMRNHKPGTDFTNLMKALVYYYNTAVAYTTSASKAA